MQLTKNEIAILCDVFHRVEFEPGKIISRTDEMIFTLDKFEAFEAQDAIHFDVLKKINSDLRFENHDQQIQVFAGENTVPVQLWAKYEGNPALTDFESKTLLCTAQEFIDAVTACLPAMQDNEARRNLMCVHLAKNFAESTNGHILIRKNLALNFDQEDFCVPAAVVKFLKKHGKKLLAGKLGVVEYRFIPEKTRIDEQGRTCIHPSEKRLFLTFPEATLEIHHLDYSFPRCDVLIPNDTPSRFAPDTSKLMETLKKAIPLIKTQQIANGHDKDAKNKFFAVKLTVDSESLAFSDEFGGHYNGVNCQRLSHGVFYPVGFNASYLLKIIEGLGEKFGQMEWGYQGSSMPMLVKNNSGLAVIMPLRINF